MLAGNVQGIVLTATINLVNGRSFLFYQNEPVSSGRLEGDSAKRKGRAKKGAIGTRREKCSVLHFFVVFSFFLFWLAVFFFFLPAHQ